MVGSTRPSSSRRSRPVRSMASLMSVCTTVPLGADLAGEGARQVAGAAGDVQHLVARRARWPPPPCRPSRRGAGPATSGRSSRRTSTPPSRRRRARGCAFSASSTVLKPKWVCAMAASVDGQWRGRRTSPPGAGHRRVAVDAGGRQALLVRRQSSSCCDAQEVQVVPGKDAGVVAVGEASAARRSCRPARARRCRTSRLPVCSTSWPGPWPCTSADGEYTRISSKGMRNVAAVVEAHLEHARRLVHGERGGLGVLGSRPAMGWIAVSLGSVRPCEGMRTSLSAVGFRPARARCRRRWRAPRSRGSQSRPRILLRHLDDDVVGLEQAVVQVAL